MQQQRHRQHSSSPVFPSPLMSRDSSSFPPYLTVTLPASSPPFLFYPLYLSSPSEPVSQYAPTERTSPPLSLRYPPPFLLSYSPHSLQRLLSNPLVSSRRCTTHVLTEQRTSDLSAGSRCNPLPRAPPSLEGSFRRKHLALLSRLSRRLSSRLETVRCAGDPGTIPSRTPGFACRDGASVHHEVDARLTRSDQGALPPFLPFSLRFCPVPDAIRCGWLVLMRIKLDYINLLVVIALVVFFVYFHF